MAAVSELRRSDVWIRMLLYPRHTIPTAAAPVIVATGLALHDHVFSLAAAVASFLVGFLVQLGGVFTDNYENIRRHGDDDPEHADFVRALKTGLISRGELLVAIYSCYAVALLPGAYLLYVGGLPVLVIGVASVMASLAYSVGPFPLGDHALGDPLFFLFFGVVSVVATYYAMAAASLSAVFPLVAPPGTLSVNAVVASLPVAALATNILVIDNIRDFDFDRAKGEVTLAGVIGTSWSRVEYLGLSAVAYAIPIGFCLEGRWGPATLLPLVSLPYAVIVAIAVWRRRSHEALQPMTPRAGQVLLAYSILECLGFIWVTGP